MSGWEAGSGGEHDNGNSKAEAEGKTGLSRSASRPFFEPARLSHFVGSQPISRPTSLDSPHSPFHSPPFASTHFLLLTDFVFYAYPALSSTVNCIQMHLGNPISNDLHCQRLHRRSASFCP